MSNDSPIPVTDADRLLLKAIYIPACHEAIDRGDYDSHEDAQAVAAHRITSIAPLVEVLEPFVTAYEKRFDRYVRANSNWHHEMPGDWPIELMLTVDDCRKARAALSRIKGDGR